MSESTTEPEPERIDRDGEEFDFKQHGEMLQASYGSYRQGLDGMSLSLNLDAVGESNKLVTLQTLRAMFDELWERALDEMDLEPGPDISYEPIDGELHDQRFDHDTLYTEVDTETESWEEVWKFQRARRTHTEEETVTETDN